jgi:AcrR family transcriptional regulator
VARSAALTREHVLEVAHELFYWNGIRATGVDRVAAEAGVAPTTLYRLFASKDDLVGAYMERAARLYREWFDAAARGGGTEARQQILAVFDALTEQVQPGQCRGCPFLMALAEFPGPEHPAHRHAVAVKGWVRARLGELVAELGPGGTAEALGERLVGGDAEVLGERLVGGDAEVLGERLAGGDAEVLADQLALVMEGVYGSVQALGVAGPAQRARAFVEVLLGGDGRLEPRPVPKK